jgi:3-oxoacyl-[acyl-carrier protein] reductase
MEIRFDNKAVLVTGASSGIGRATALAFGRSGANVVVHYNESKEEAEDVVRSIESSGGKAIALGGDVSRKEDVHAMVQAAVHRFGTVDILVNNAGTLVRRKGIEELDLDLWNRVMAVNLTGALLMSQEVIPLMKKKGYGRIIHSASVSARTGGSMGTAHYSASKAAVLALTRNMARELAPYNILVNAISPGIIDTRFHERFTRAEDFKAASGNVVLKRAGTAEECAGPILFLASDQASYITGETLEVNGGLLMD